jgi:hypothetical protein
MWRQASLPAVEGGILPPGKIAGVTATLIFSTAGGGTTFFPPGWKPRIYVDALQRDPDVVMAHAAAARLFRPRR